MTEQHRLVVCASHSPGMERDTERVLGTTFREGLARARQMVADFAPDYVVLFGGDHRRAFQHVVPAFGVALSAGIMAEAGRPAGKLEVPYKRARALSERLLSDGIDISVCRDVELDHAFAQPLRDLVGGVDELPVVPIPVNCATAPLPTARRALALGRAVGGFLDEQQERVLVIGTGGLAHSPPSLEVETYDLSDEDRAKLIAEGFPTAHKKMKPEWDKKFLETVEAWDEDALMSLADQATEHAGVGANEVRTWLAAGAAAGGKKLRTVTYQPVEEWVTGMAVAASV